MKRYLSLFFSVCFVSVFAQSNDSDIKSYPVKYVEKSATIVLSEVDDWYVKMKNVTKSVEHGTNSSKEEYNRAKAIANATKHRNPDAVELSNKTEVATPSELKSFEGNAFFDHFPNDNEIAVSKGGYMLSAMNSNISVFDLDGNSLMNKSLEAFTTAVGLTANKFDPRVMYDPENDRFIFVCLNGLNATVGHLVIGFSKTNDPRGAWNLYKIKNGPKSGEFLDYPYTVINNEELIISGNVFASNFQRGGAFWQIRLSDGYEGKNLTTKLHTTSDLVTVTPVRAGSVFYGPEVFFIAALGGQSAQTQIYLYELTNSISNGGIMKSKVFLNSNKAYNFPPDGDQRGSTSRLETGNQRIRSAYYQNGHIYFALTTNDGGGASAYIGDIDVKPIRSQSTIKATIFSSPTYEYAYPSVMYGGCTALDGRNSTFVFMLHTSTIKFPGTAIAYIDTLGNKSQVQIVKEGTSKMGVGGFGAIRWGDYTDIVPDYANPGRVWAAGSFGKASNNNGTWISSFEVDGCNDPILSESTELKNEPKEIKVFPNPADEIISLNLDVTAKGFYKASVYDINGRLLKVLIEDMLVPGTALLQFNTLELSPGSYYVQVTGESDYFQTKKFVVSR